MEVQALLVIT